MIKPINKRFQQNKSREREKRQNNAKIWVRYGRTFSTKVRSGTVRYGTL